MKKVIISLGIMLVLSSLSYSSPNIELSLGNIEKEFKILEQKEKEKFKGEERKAQISQQKYNDYVLMINTIGERVSLLQASEKKSFFPQQHKTLLDNYRKLDRELRVSAGNEKKQIEEFNQLRSILGY